MSQTIQVKGKLQSVLRFPRFSGKHYPENFFCSDCKCKLYASSWRQIPVIYSFKIKKEAYSICIRCIREPKKFFSKPPKSDKQLERFVKPFVQRYERQEKELKRIIKKKEKKKLNSTTFCKVFRHNRCTGLTMSKHPCECHCHEVDFENRDEGF